MTTVAEAAAELEAALKTVERNGKRVRCYTDPGANVDPPATVLGPPALTFDAYCVEPTSARWLVYLVMPADARAMPRLWELVPLVAAAVEHETGGAVTRADPGVFTSGGTDLPAYLIQVDYPL